MTAIKCRITTFLILLCLAGMTYAQQFNFEWQEVQRPYIVRLPASTYDDTPPVLFFLHGLGDNIARVDSEYHFSALADRFGWVMVVPQARNQGGYSMWNAAMYSSDIDDVGFLMALLDTLTAQHHLDPDSVFFTGFSMGGFMTHRMAIEKGDRAPKHHREVGETMNKSSIVTWDCTMPLWAFRLTPKVVIMINCNALRVWVASRNTWIFFRSLSS